MTWIKKGNIFNKHHAQLPVVDTYHNYYRIYYSTRDEKGCSIPMFYQVYKRDLNESLGDPVKVNIPLGKPGSFDHYGVMPSSIVSLENGVKYMYYVGWSKRIDVPYNNSTGLAISKDNGITWEKYSEGPVFGNCANEPGFVGTVDVKRMKEDNWLMIYSSCRWEMIDGKQEPVYDIKPAYSKDGINWTASKDTLIELEGEEGGIAAARIHFQPEFNIMYYSLRNKRDYRTNPINSYKIKSAIYVGDKFVKNQLSEMELGEGENMNAYPFLIEEEDKFIMFYNGCDFGKGGISYAEKAK